MCKTMRKMWATPWAVGNVNNFSSLSPDLSTAPATTGGDFLPLFHVIHPSYYYDYCLLI